MARLEEILKGEEPAIRERVAGALALMARQAVGAEAFRSRAEAWLKSDDSPVTIADLVHQFQIQEFLARDWPGDALISEEPRSLQEEALERATAVSSEAYGIELSGQMPEVPDHGDEVVWILDPIDGTKGYLAGRFYAIALGFFVGGEGRFGAMAVPRVPEPIDGPSLRMAGSLAFSITGRGAWIAKLGGEAAKLEFERLDGGLADRPERVRVAVSLEHGNSADRLGDLTPAKLDSQAKYLAVATGDLEIYIREKRNDGHPDVTWDHMPGGLIAREAGCQVEHFDGGPLVASPRRVIEFRGGFVCYRGNRGGPLAGDVAKLTGR